MNTPDRKSGVKIKNSMISERIPEFMPDIAKMLSPVNARRSPNCAQLQPVGDRKYIVREARVQTRVELQRAEGGAVDRIRRDLRVAKIALPVSSFQHRAKSNGEGAVRKRFGHR